MSSGYDMCVDTAALRSIMGSMNRRCDAIQSCAETMKRSVVTANADYDDVNYEKIVEHADGVSRSVALFADKIKKLEAYLQKLERKVDEYSSSGYKG